MESHAQKPLLDDPASKALQSDTNLPLTQIDELSKKKHVTHTNQTVNI